MIVTITSRKTTVRDSFKEKVEKKLAKFDRFFDDDTKALVTVTNEKGRETVEVTILSRNMTFRAEKTTEDRLDSLDAVVDTLFKQIVKNKDRLAKRLRGGAFDVEVSADDEVFEDDEYRIVRNKRFPIKPMTVDEAILEMNMVGHSFYMFQNGDSGEYNVVYRRNDGDYGLIEPE